jgi:hypothetical protein
VSRQQLVRQPQTVLQIGKRVAPKWLPASYAPTLNLLTRA